MSKATMEAIIRSEKYESHGETSENSFRSLALQVLQNLPKEMNEKDMVSFFDTLFLFWKSFKNTEDELTESRWIDFADALFYQKGLTKGVKLFADERDCIERCMDAYRGMKDLSSGKTPRFYLSCAVEFHRLPPDAELEEMMRDPDEFAVLEFNHRNALNSNIKFAMSLAIRATQDMNTKGCLLKILTEMEANPDVPNQLNRRTIKKYLHAFTMRAALPVNVPFNKGSMFGNTDQMKGFYLYLSLENQQLLREACPEHTINYIQGEFGRGNRLEIRGKPPVPVKDMVCGL